MPKHEYTVANYMQTNVNTLAPTATFQEAVETMLERKTNGLVIINGDQRIAGILSSWDLIRYLVPDYLEEDRHLAPFEAGGLFVERLKMIAKDPITKFMSKGVITVNEHHTIMEAAILLSENKIRQLPVVDDEKKLVGYINRTDIKKAMGDVLAG